MSRLHRARRRARYAAFLGTVILPLILSGTFTVGIAATTQALVNAPAAGPITLLINGQPSGLTVASTGTTRTVTGTASGPGTLTAIGAFGTATLGAVVPAISLASAAIVVTRSGVSYSAPLTALAA